MRTLSGLIPAANWRRILAGVLSAAIAAAPVAAEPAPSADDIPGHYYLSGLMEVGSELLLTPDGDFQWMIAYGSVDQAAEGRWTSDGRTVVLTSRPQSADGVRFRLGEKAGWDERAARFLERRREWEALETRARNCPLMSLSNEDRVEVAIAPTAGAPARPDLARLKAEADRAHDAAQASLDRLKGRAAWRQDRALVENADAAIILYQDRMAELRGALDLEGRADVEPAPFDVPAECRLSDWEKEVAAFRGVAIQVFDPERYLRGDGIEVEARYDRGAPVSDVVMGGYAYLPLARGRRITAIALRVPGAVNDHEAIFPVILAEPSVQLVDADLGSLIEPAFTRLVLTINGDGSLTPQGEMSRGVYRKPPSAPVSAPAPDSDDPADNCSAADQLVSAAQVFPKEWQAEVGRRLQSAQTYPLEARAQGIEGTVYIKFRADRRGNVKSAVVDRSSGSELLDNAALEAARRAQPLPALPCGAPEEVDFILPVRFLTQ